MRKKLDRDYLETVRGGIVWKNCAERIGDSLTVRLAQQDRGTVLTVFNSGIQIPDEELVHFFVVFYRAAPSRSRETGGSRLGLHLVSLIANCHGGGCTVRNLDRGVETTLWLPLHKNSI